MAVLQTSGQYPYSLTCIQIARAALRNCQVIQEDETPTGSQLETAMDALNAMVKGWQADQIHLWCEEECILFLQPNQTQYALSSVSPDHATLFNSLNQSALAATAGAGAMTLTLASAAGILQGDTIGVQLDAGSNFWTTVTTAPSGNIVSLSAALPSQASQGAIVFDYTVPLVRPLRVMSGRRYQYSSQQNIPMIALSRVDYYSLPNPKTTGTITQFFFDPQQGQGSYVNANATALMTLWPTPASNQFGLRFTAQRPIQTFATLADTPDFPDEWMAALKWNLALELAPEYGCPADLVTALIAPNADKWLALCKAWDREPQSVLFGYAHEPGYRQG